MIRKCYKFYTLIMTLMWVMAAMTASAFAVDDMWTVANRIIVPSHPRISAARSTPQCRCPPTFHKGSMFPTPRCRRCLH